MPTHIDPQNVEATIRDIQEATDGLSAALRDVDSARSHLQTVQAQRNASSDSPGEAGDPVTTARNSLEQAQHDAERERSTLQQAIRKGERLMDRLDEGVRSAKEDRSKLQSGQQKVQNRDARSKMAAGAQRLQEEVEQLRTWRRELSSALRASDKTLSSPGHTPPASSSTSSGFRSSLGQRYSRRGVGYDLSPPAYVSEHVRTPSLSEQLRAHAGPDGNIYNLDPVYEAAWQSDPAYSNGPPPALGGESGEGSWLEKLVSDSPVSHLPSRQSTSGLFDTVRSLTTAMDAAPHDSAAARQSLYDTIQMYDPSVNAAPGDPYTSPNYDGW